MITLIIRLLIVLTIFNNAYAAGPTIVLLEAPILISSSLFSGRVQVLEPFDKEVDPDFAAHGVSVASVLVGPDRVGKLPTDVSVYMAEGWEGLASRLQKSGISKERLLVINWSGIHGAEHLDLIEHYTGLLEVILENVTEKPLAETLSFMEKLITDLRAEASSVGASDDKASHRLSSLFSALDKISVALKEQQKAESFDRSNVEGIAKAAINPLIEAPQAKARKIREQILKDMTELMQVFPNTLIVWALGNDGECIDQNTEWTDYLSQLDVLERTILVEGSTSWGTRSSRSNFTKAFTEHAVKAGYGQNIWDGKKITRGEATSFSAAAVTAEAYRLAIEEKITDSKTLKAALLALSKTKVLE